MIPVEGGHDHHSRRGPAILQGYAFQTVSTFHLQIEQNEIGGRHAWANASSILLASLTVVRGSLISNIRATLERNKA
ncbi:hypothetical protein ALP06_100562 [Pseudomonas coronafaciens pv. atropurpurea]|nr:hypothetical protein ALP06_100562 [Pseudomonas coronafaciens pv. atropurpurea]